ncbi:MAG: hypothetical protein P8I30_00420, partial [Flavobacteriaceae bacterium]|nr:hypothetical protein [Flavobacteriaceae bacterium]
LFSNCSEHKKTNSNTTDNTVVFATQLPKKINETSGLEYFDGQLITHNDSGDDALLYGFSKTGALSTISELKGITVAARKLATKRPQ